MRFAEPLALALAVLVPAAGLLLWFAARRTRAALTRFGARAGRLLERDRRGRRRLGDLLLLAAAVLFVAAAARPQWGREEREITLVGVDVLFALDTSFSMDARDVAPSRMERARYIASSVLDRIPGNRAGIVAFAGSAFTQCPLTHDLAAVRTLLAGVATGAVENPGTNLAAMIVEAERAFERQESRHRVVVLLTDGRQDDLRVTPVAEVAARAEAAGIVVLAVGVGTEGGATIPVPAESGPTLMRDAAGAPIVNRLDAGALSELAARTGGAFFPVSPDDREVAAMTERITGMEGGELGDEVSRRYRERFYLPAGAGFALLFAHALVAWNAGLGSGKSAPREARSGNRLSRAPPRGDREGGP